MVNETVSPTGIVRFMGLTFPGDSLRRSRHTPTAWNLIVLSRKCQGQFRDFPWNLTDPGRSDRSEPVAPPRGPARLPAHAGEQDPRGRIGLVYMTFFLAGVTLL